MTHLASTSKTSTTRVVLPLVSTSRANPSASQKPDRARTFILQLHDQGGNQSTRTYDKGKPFCIAETGPGPYLQPQADRPAASSFRVGTFVTPRRVIPAGGLLRPQHPTESVNIPTDRRTTSSSRLFQRGKRIPHPHRTLPVPHPASSTVVIVKHPTDRRRFRSDVLFHARSNRVQSSS